MFYLLLPAPLWLVVALFTASVSLTVGLFWHLQRRLNNHAESIVNMDDWADGVERELNKYREAQRKAAQKDYARKQPTYDPTIFR